MAHITSRPVHCAALCIAALVLASFVLLLPATPAAAFTGCQKADTTAQRADFEQRVVQLVNQERAKAGLPPVKYSATLSGASRYHAVDLGTDGYFEHDTFDVSGGAKRKVCDWVTRIRNWYTGFSGLGENVAAGQQTPEAVMSSWMGSQYHKANILNPGFTEMGIGFYIDSANPAASKPTFWVQDFGVRDGVYPMVIGGEASTVASRNVQVYVHGDFTEIRLRNGSAAWSSWQPFQNSFAWTLAARNGEQIVSAEMRGNGRSAATCDKVTLAAASAAELEPAESDVQAMPDEASRKLYLPLLKNGEAEVVACNE